MSVVFADGEDNFAHWLPFLRKLNVPYICLKDKIWGARRCLSNGDIPDSQLRTRDILRGSGTGAFMATSRKAGWGRKQVTQGKMGVGEISKEQIPMLFCDLIRRHSQVRRQSKPVVRLRFRAVKDQGHGGINSLPEKPI